MTWMEALGRQLTRKPVAWATVLVAVALSAVGAVYASQVDQDDDLLAFLPKDNPEVAAFDEINERFGGLDVALVGIPVDDPFQPAFLTTLREVTRELDTLSDVDHALSLTSVEDFRPDPAGGIRADYLVGEIPETAEEKAALRQLVMSRDHVVGNLISADGKAVTIYCFAAHGADTRAFAGQVREVVERGFPEHTKYWGGAPFISTYIYDLTQKDMDRLIPWAVAVIVLIIVLSFRDVLGAALALLSTGMGIAISRGLMGLFGVKANIVLSSMPVILFAVGSAYGIHILVRYYATVRDRDPDQALVATMADIGPTVLAAGLTTVAGLLSFVTMDIAPMRSFGLFTAIGILATLILALTFIPAVVRLLGLKGRRPAEGPLSRALVRVVRFAHGRRRAFAAGLLLVGAAAALTAGRVEARMENAAFFSAGSPPDQAERFLRERFGGSTFLQIEIEGDMADPQVLREVQRTADELAVLPHVSSVNHIGKVLGLVNESMTDERRLPTTTEQVQTLYRFLQGRSAVRQLGTDDRRYAMLLVKIDTDRFEDVETLLGAVERWAAEQAIRSYRIVDLEEPSEQGQAWLDGVVRARLTAHLHDQGMPLADGARQKLPEALASLNATADRAAMSKRLAAYLHSDESILEPSQKDLVEPLTKALVAVGPQPSDEQRLGAIAEALERDEDDALVEDLDLFLM
ncbi:MAG: MMPL family transporter, partial [Deltaproteobacteria bacterium]|nr:MMPL family transporter [Deltaproteobacteria bacterium]MBW2534982.1 MMPL family transporter [Deltaproteobacteria bacterium]